MIAKYTVGAAALLIGPALGLAQNAEEEAAASEETINCVSLMSVERTEAVDEQTLLFHMRDGDVYRNVLPHRCPGLDPDQTFMYRVTTSQLCNVDVITVLENIGPGFMPGAACGLGKFQPISEETAEEIIRTAERDDESD